MKTKNQDQKPLTKTQLALGTLADVVSGIVNDKVVFSPAELKKQRLEICSACPFYENPKCSKCGCFMEAKASLVKAKCPLGFWKEKIVEKLVTGEISPQYIERDCCNGR